MTRLVAGIFGLVISIILFMGFSVINLLSGDEASKYVGKTTADFFKGSKPWLYGVVGLIFAVQQIWLRWPKPGSLSDVEDLRGAVEPLLETVLTEYYSTIPKSSQPAPTVRINIMLPTWRRFRLGCYLKIYYSHGGPAGVRYPDDELDLKWARKKGTCGYAWAVKRPVIYDSENHDFKAPEKRLTPTSIQVVGYIKSVLSVPIWSKAHKKVIGVLNLDSTWNIDRTHFHQEQVIRPLVARARVFSTMLFTDGVKPN